MKAMEIELNCVYLNLITNKKDGFISSLYTIFIGYNMDSIQK
jgi:hypothetical protein